MADFNIQRCFGIALAWVVLHYAALFFILKSVFGLLLRRLVLALCSPVLHTQRFLGLLSRGLLLLYAAPFFIFKGVFKRLQRGIRSAFMQPHQRLMMPLVADV